MRVRCPNCSHAIELVNDADFAHVSCPACGSQLSFSGSDEDTITAMVALRIPALQCFQLQQPVGVGQFGRVWKARDVELDRVVAIKIPHNQYLSAAEAGFFLHEARAAAQLSHPNIVTVHEVGRHEDTVYIVTEFIDGLSLREWTQHYRPDARESVRVVLKIARALEHAHSKGVIHRDMKPGNILMDAAGEPHVTDFGLAKREGAEVTIGATGQVLGTPAYMAPEQVRDGHAADRRSDVYAVGVILYEMLVGQRPFTGGRRLLLQQVLHDEPRRPRSVDKKVPRDLETICLKALAKKPEERYQSAEDLAADLERFLAGKPVHARPIAAPVRWVRWCQRHPAATAITTLALMLAGVIAWAIVGGNRGVSRTARPVAIATSPSGAEVVMVPLHATTGVPDFDRQVRAGRSPVRFRCEPGDYLVIACQDDRLFHEVYRHVPGAHEELPGIYRHSAWSLDGETIVLPSVTLFATEDVTADMAHVDGGTFVMPTTDLAMDKTIDVAEFYVDVTEVTVGQVRRLGLPLPNDMQDPTVAEHMPLHNVTWYEAAVYAEAMGKRLLRDEEYEYIVTLGGSQTDSPAGWEVTDAAVPGPVTQAEFDRLEWARLSQPVLGMRSNVLEWTDSWWAGTSSGADRRIVRGGYHLGDDEKSQGFDYRTPPPRKIYYAPLALPRLGFRCARSAHPRVAAK